MDIMLKDPELQRRIEEDGYVVIPCLAEAEINTLARLFEDIRPKELKGIYSNVYNGEAYEENLRVDATIKGIFEKIIGDLFVNCYMAGGTFLVKGCGEGSESKLHQDWNNVDESKHLSLSIWCPLIDVDEHNGCLQVIKGSYRMVQTIRAITIPSVFLEFDETLDHYLTPVPMKAGEACIYAHNLFHGSKPNHTDQIRVSAVSGVLPKNAQHIHYYHNRNKMEKAVEVFAIDNNFYYKDIYGLFDGSRPNHLPKVGEVEYHCQPVKPDLLFDLADQALFNGQSPRIKPTSVKPKKSLINRILEVFS